jgi:phage FluMu gp28-like protein
VPKVPSGATQRAGKGANGEQKQQRHGDFAIGLFLAHYAMRQEGATGNCRGFESVSRRRSLGDDYDEERGRGSRHML